MINKKERKEIFYHLVNSLIAGALVFAGTLADGNISKQGILTAIGASLLVAIQKFRKYWKGEKQEYTNLLSFI